MGVIAAVLLVLPASASAAGIAPAPNYSQFSSTNNSIATTTSLLSGSNCDDCVVTTPLPFDFAFMGKVYTAGSTLYVGSNGSISFDTNFTSGDFVSACPLPDTGGVHHGAAIFALWEDLDSSAAASPTEGIFTSVSGSAPNRVFNIEWRTQRHNVGSAGDVNFEVQLRESSGSIEVIYAAPDNLGGSNAAVGIQQASAAGSAADAFECHTGGITAKEGVTFTPQHPSITGVLEEGQTLTANPNGFTGSPLPSITYQWQRCDSSGNTSTCVNLLGQTSNQILLTHADVGNTMRVRVDAMNASGSASTFSSVTELIKLGPAPAPVYTVTHGGGATFISGVTNVGNSGDDVESPITLPFPVRFYGQQYATAIVTSNGTLRFGGPVPGSGSNTTSCMPNDVASDAIEAYQMDLRTDSPGTGVFSRVTGATPHRTFVLDYRTVYYSDTSKTARFEILLREDSPVVSVVYGPSADTGESAVAGVQHDPGGPFTQFFCGDDSNPGSLTAGTVLHYAPSQPKVLGLAKQGHSLTFTGATFSGSPTLKQQWERCNRNGFSCGDIPGATRSSYTPTVNDIGMTLRVRQIATNGFGTGTSESDPSAVVAANSAPKLTKLRLDPDSFAAAGKGGSIAKATGTKVSFRLSFAGSVLFTVARVKNGKRTALKGSFKFKGKAGPDSFHFTGRLNGQALIPANYVLFAQTNAGGHTGGKVSAPFKIVR